MEKAAKIPITISACGRILFYDASDPNGFMSNFYASKFTIRGKEWPTTEHYFQAQKFVGTDAEEKIRLAPNPRKAFQMGRNRDPKNPIRPDWEAVKDDVMYECLMAKFTQSDDLKQALMDTKSHELIEHTNRDKYWADGGDGSGKNMLGKLLVKLRTELTPKEIITE